MIRKPLLLNSLPIGDNYLDLIVNQTADQPLEAIDASVVLNIDGASSSASIRLPAGTKVDGRAFVEMFTVQGSAGVFRTRSPQIGYGGQSTTINLEHSVNEMGDYVINDKFEQEMTLKAAIKKIFGYYSEKSSIWALGRVDDPVFEEDDNPKCVLSVDHDNCLEAIQSVMEQFPTMMLSFNFTTRPFKLNVVCKDTIVSAEGRLSRNVKSASVVRDDSELCTRAYMDGYKTSGSKFGSYNSKNAQKKYGIIEAVVSGANDTPAIAERTIKNYLKTHKKPRYSVNIEGIELSKITGETLDKFTIGKLFRLAVPKYKETIVETLTQLNFPSIYKSPNSVSIVLADENDRVIRYIKKAQKTAGKAAASAKSISKAAIVDATVENNILTLTKGDGTQVNFSKAVTLDSGWSGGRYTVKVKQTQVEGGKKVEKQVASASTKLNGIVLQTNKQPTVSGAYDLKIPLKVMYDNGLPASMGNKSNTEYSEEITVSAKPVYDKGRNAVKIKPFEANPITGTLPDHRTFTYKTDAPTPQPRSDTWYLVGSNWSNYEKSVYLQSPTQINYARLDIDARPIANAVEINAPTWTNTPGASPSSNSNTATFKTNAPTPKQRTLALYLSPGDWSGNKKIVYLSHTDSTEANRIARYEVDATSRWEAGWNAVTISSIGLASNYSPITGNGTRSSIYLQAVASNGATKNDKLVTLALNTYNSGNHCVNLLDGSDIIGRISTESVYTAGQNSVDINAPTWANSPGSSPSSNSNTATFKTDAPTQKSRTLALYLSTSGWSNGSNTIYLSHTDSASNHRIAKTTVSNSWSIPNAPSSGGTEPTGTFDASWSVSKGNTWIWFTITVNGQSKKIKIKLTT